MQRRNLQYSEKGTNDHSRVMAWLIDTTQIWESRIGERPQNECGLVRLLLTNINLYFMLKYQPKRMRPIFPNTDQQLAVAPKHC